MRQFAGVAGVLVLAGSACADVAFNNFGTGDSYSGNGFIVYGPLAPGGWTHGFQFVAQVGGGVTRLVVPMQYLQGATNGYTFEVYSDAGNVPGVSLGLIGQTPGFVNGGPPLPPPLSITADGHIALAQGTTYWVVGKGLGDTQGTWHANDQGQVGLRAYQLGGGGWTTGSVVIGAFRVEVLPSAGECYANCDGSTAAPVLNVADFTCFLTKFVAADPYANCDGSTAAPVLNVADFTCFLTKFVAGCS